MVDKEPAKNKKQSDISDLEKRIIKLKKHLSENKHDYTTKRTLTIKEAKLRKLKKYKERKEK